MRKKLLITGVALGAGLACGLANAAVFNLCAGTTTVSMPDGTPPITMWGYALDAAGDGCANDAIQSPGPILTVPYNDPNVTINLTNNLPVETSLVMPGQSAAMTPVFTTDTQARQRVTSLTHVTAPGTTGNYVWSNLKPGSHAYHSGTHMAVQVQMGLYGGMKKDAALGTAYAGVPYDQEATIFYSEIDPAMHAAVAGGTYGTTGPTSTINYQPKYFLVNGAPYAAGSAPLPAANAGQRTLLRFFNMGLRTVAPTVLGQHVKVVAEDGRPYPYAREQYSLMMAAGKTHDAIFTTTQNGNYPIYDRLLNLSSGAMAPSGLYTSLSVGAPAAGAPVATADSYTVAEDTPLSIPAPGVLANDTGTPLTALVAGAASGGNVSLASNGSFTFTPAANFNGTAQFSYQVSDGVNTSLPATVSINVTPVNDKPVAVGDSYVTTAGKALSVANPGVLANDSDVDSTNLLVRVGAVTQPANGTLQIYWLGRFTYTPNPGFTGVDTFTYSVKDDLNAISNVATVSITVSAPAGNTPPVANDDFATTTMNTAVSIPVLANDTDAGGSLDKTSVTLVSAPTKGGNKVWVNPTYGGIRFIPGTGFRGTDTFTYTVKDNLGAVSNIATVQVNVN
jgi:hypothetical protein